MSGLVCKYCGKSDPPPDQVMIVAFEKFSGIEKLRRAAYPIHELVGGASCFEEYANWTRRPIIEWKISMEEIRRVLAHETTRKEVEKRIAEEIGIDPKYTRQLLKKVVRDYYQTFVAPNNKKRKPAAKQKEMFDGD